MKTGKGDVSVPITWAYNHHFEAYIKGALSEMRLTTPIQHQNLEFLFLKYFPREMVGNIENPITVTQREWLSC